METPRPQSNRVTFRKCENCHWQMSTGKKIWVAANDLTALKESLFFLPFHSRGTLPRSALTSNGPSRIFVVFASYFPFSFTSIFSTDFRFLIFLVSPLRVTSYSELKLHILFLVMIKLHVALFEYNIYVQKYQKLFGDWKIELKMASCLRFFS